MSRRNYREKILEVLGESQIPMDTENIRVKAGIKSWSTAKATLLELVLERKILGAKTTKSWIFWVVKESSTETASRPGIV
jgi:hypothetical protein